MVSEGAWEKYISTLRQLNETAARKVLAKIEELEQMGLSEEELTKELIDYAYAVATTYGEGSAAAACEMYDALAEVQGANVPPAVPADPPSYRDVAKTVNGTRKFSQNPNVTADGISRLVKRTGADTTVNNAIRDGVEWAWIPHGDTCAFCLTLASRGWQKASKKALKNGHAEHIHAHCDCTYAIRFDSKMDVEGYDPNVLRDQYYAAEGNTPQERINSMRRADYAKNRERINAQKREAYAKKTNSLHATDTRSIMNVETGGQRNETPLTEKQIEECCTYAESLGMPREKMAYSDSYWTSYSPEFDLLLIGTDAYPGIGATSANGRLSYRSAIAHEIVGHREASFRGRTHFPKGDFRDEAQASIRAARFAPDLTNEDRYLLIKDALDRIHHQGYKLRDVKHLLDISER